MLTASLGSKRRPATRCSTHTTPCVRSCGFIPSHQGGVFSRRLRSRWRLEAPFQQQDAMAGRTLCRVQVAGDPHDGHGHTQPRLLTMQINKSRSFQDLVCVCQTCHTMNPIHVSAALTACVKHMPQLHRQEQQGQQHHAEFLFSGHAGICHNSAHDRPQQPSPQQQQELWCVPPDQLTDFVSWSLACLAPQLHLCSGREIANILWCLAKLQQQPSAAMLQQLLARFADVAHTSSCQAFSMVLYALATLRHQPHSAWLDNHLKCMVKTAMDGTSFMATNFNSTLELQQRRQAPKQQQLGPEQQRLDQLHGQGEHQQCSERHEQEHCNAFNQQQPPLPTQALSNAIWALARLHQPAVALVWLLPLLCLLCRHTTAACESSPLPTPQSGQQDRSACLPVPGSQQIVVQAAANVLWACAVLLPAHTGTAAAAVSAVEARGVYAPSMAPGMPGYVLAVDCQPPAYLQSLASVQARASWLLERCQHSLSRAAPQELVMLVWACGRLRVTPSMAWVAQLWQASGRVMGCCTGQECVALLYSAAVLRMPPTAAWLAQFMRVTQPLLGGLKSQQISCLIWACGTLRVRPPARWMSTALAAFQQQLPHSSPVAVSMVVWGASKIGYQPAAPAVDCLLAAAVNRLSDYTTHQMAKLLLGCAALRLTVPCDWLHRLLAAFLGQLHKANPQDVVMLLRALAKMQPQAECKQLCRHPRQLHCLVSQQRVPSKCKASVPGAPEQACVVHLFHARNNDGHVCYLHSATATVACCGVATACCGMASQGCSPAKRKWQLWQAGQQPCSGLQQGGMNAPSLTLPTVGSRFVGQGVMVLHRNCFTRLSMHACMHACEPCDVTVELLFVHAEQHVGGMSAWELCQCLWSAVRLGAKLSQSWSHAVNHTLVSQMHLLGPGDLCLLLWSLSKLHGVVHLKRMLHKQLLVHSQRLLLSGQFTPRDLTTFIWSYARVFGANHNALPGQWVAAFGKAVVASMFDGFTPKQVGVLLRALALMRVVVGQELLDTAALLVEVWSASLAGGDMALISSSIIQLQQCRLAAQVHVSEFNINMWQPSRSFLVRSLLLHASVNVSQGIEKWVQTPYIWI